jgi:hypothetical protein
MEPNDRPVAARQTTQTILARQLLDEKIIVDAGGFLDLTSKGRGRTTTANARAISLFSRVF